MRDDRICDGGGTAAAGRASETASPYAWTTESLAVPDHRNILDRLGHGKLDSRSGPSLVHRLDGSGNALLLDELARATSRQRPASAKAGSNQPVGCWPTGRAVALVTGIVTRACRPASVPGHWPTVPEHPLRDTSGQLPSGLLLAG